MPALGRIQDHLGATFQLLVEPLFAGCRQTTRRAFFQTWILREDALDIFNTMEWAKLGSM
jgi:hypothetical protein